MEGSCSEPFGVSEVYSNNESTAGADASVEVSNNITNKATSNSLYTHYIIFAILLQAEYRETQRVGND